VSTPATSRNELPLFFPAGEDLLFGILTRPTSVANGAAVVIAAGGGTPLSTNVNGLSVRLCRRVAALGFHALRFDYHGLGESSGRLGEFDLTAPFVSDVSAALQCLRDRGVERFVLVGSCYGARAVLAVAPATEGLEAIVLISPPIRDFEMGQRVATHLAGHLKPWDFVRRALSVRGISGLFDADRRRTYSKLVREKLRRTNGSSDSGLKDREARYVISPRFLEPLGALARGGATVSIIYGEADDYWREFEQARSTDLGRIWLQGGPNMMLTTLPGHVHGFRSADVQERVLDIVATQLSDLRIDAGSRIATSDPRTRTSDEAVVPRSAGTV
jgi:pimeloyl-ACP methyl ester carboxylesterase